MSYSVDVTEISAIIKEIEQSNSNEIEWSDFVIAAKAHIIQSSPSFETSEKLRKFWVKSAKDMTQNSGYCLNMGNDNWDVIERDLNTTYEPASASSLASPALPFALETPQSSTQSRRTSRSSSTLGILLTESKKEAALSLFESMEDGQKWKLRSGRCVEDVMKSFVQELDFEQ